LISKSNSTYISKLSGIRNEARKMNESINAWEGKYVFKSTINGHVTYFRSIKANDAVKQGEVLMSVNPENNGALVINGMVKSNIAYKLHKGQHINIKLNDFPEQEYGSIKGEIINILPVEVNGYYLLNIVLEKGFLSSSQKKIPFRYQYKGMGEIMVEDKSVLQRLFDKQISN